MMETTAKGIVWGRVWAIAAVQSALTLMWLVYRTYLGNMLANWGFSAEFTTQLLAFEVLLALVMEPVFGLLSDRQQQYLGSRAPLITLGVILSAATFLGLPLLALLQLPLRWVLPAVAIAWALAMTIFRTPIYVWLLKSAPKQAELPLAMAILTMLGSFIAAIKGNIQTFLLTLGTIPAFLLGTIALLGASIFLRYFMPPIEQPATTSTTPLPWRGLVQTTVMAIALAWGSTVFTNVLKSLQWGVMTTNLLLAVTAIPVGWLALRYAKYPLMAIALGWLGILLLIFAQITVASWTLIPLLGLWAWAFSTMKNGTLPYIFAVVPGPWAGFGIGVFFGVTGMANQLFPQLFPADQNHLQNIIGIMAWAIATVLALLPSIKANQANPDNDGSASFSE